MAKKEITNLNVNNALTSNDRERNWEAYMVMVKSTAKKSDKKYVYAGGDPRTKNNVYVVDKDGESEMISIQDVPSLMIRIYLGDISTKRDEEVDWYAKDARRNIIESIDHTDLNDKTQFFIKKV